MHIRSYPSPTHIKKRSLPIPTWYVPCSSMVQEQFMWVKSPCGGFLKGGTPSHHPFFFGIFHYNYKPSMLAYPHFRTPPMFCWFNLHGLVQPADLCSSTEECSTAALGDGIRIKNFYLAQYISMCILDVYNMYICIYIYISIHMCVCVCDRYACIEV